MRFPRLCQHTKLRNSLLVWGAPGPLCYIYLSPTTTTTTHNTSSLSGCSAGWTGRLLREMNPSICRVHIQVVLLRTLYTCIPGSLCTGPPAKRCAHIPARSMSPC
ncbi:hypothetical protein I7I48_09937 [Histoplasma ohiense]|nr:hypothetical protein I7I48_09937 [Histoplasma ohiense (nom. inval.)]